MGEEFDPYYRWLAIPPKDHPPNSYRLLGVELFEENADVIETAADRVMAQLRTYQTSAHSALSQKLLNEVAAARICLLTPARKAAYDQKLREGLSSPAAERTVPNQEHSSTVVMPFIAERTTASAPADRLSSGTRRSRAKSTVLMGGVAASLLVALGGFFLWGMGRGTAADTSEPAGAASPEPAPVPSHASADRAEIPPIAPSPASLAKAPALPPSPPAPPASPIDPAVPSQSLAMENTAVRGDETVVAQSQTPGKDTHPATGLLPETSQEKIAPPSAEQQKSLIRTIDEVYKVAEAKDRATLAALARTLLDDGRKNEANRNEQFVLLRRAGEVARDAGEIDLMAEAVDAIAEAGFNIPSWKTKARLLRTLPLPADSSSLAADAASCVALAQRAAAGEAFDEASEILDAAEASFGEARKSIQAAHRSARLALSRGRNAADKAEREKKVQEAEQDLAAADAALAGVADCAKALKQSLREHEAVLSARKRLEAEPGDPEACLAVGRWLCLERGDWDEGLKLLARGSDESLKSLAAKDLVAPASVEDRVARGDAWWDQADRTKGRPQAALRARAAHWYRQALPELSGLVKAKVEGRLAQSAEQKRSETTTARARPPLALAPFDTKTAQQHQARWTRFLRVSVGQANSIGMKLVLIPPGEFDMGSTKPLLDEEVQRHGKNAWYRGVLAGESPQHRVRLTRPYWFGATEVTQEEYERVMGSNPSKFLGDPKRPVEFVAWDDAVEFCRRLSELPGERAAKRRYSLPTQAQWEHACRAGNPGRRWYSGPPTSMAGDLEEKSLGQVAWFKGSSGDQPHPVAQLQVNPWGLYDMYGNVWEWCSDWDSDDYYANSPSEDPAGPAEGVKRVIRGGSWGHMPAACRSALRHSFPPKYRDHFIGLRVVAEIAE